MKEQKQFLRRGVSFKERGSLVTKEQILFKWSGRFGRAKELGGMPCEVEDQLRILGIFFLVSRPDASGARGHVAFDEIFDLNRRVVNLIFLLQHI